MIYLYLIERTDHVNYDEPESWVVAAGSELQALALVGQRESDADVSVIGQAFNANAEVIHVSTLWG